MKKIAKQVLMLSPLDQGRALRLIRWMRSDIKDDREKVETILALVKLKEPMRSVHLYRIEDGLSFKDIAELSGCSKKYLQEIYRKGSAML